MCQIRAPATAAAGQGWLRDSKEAENGFSMGWVGSERGSFGEFQLCHGKWPQPDL